MQPIAQGRGKISYHSTEALGFGNGPKSQHARSHWADLTRGQQIGTRLHEYAQMYKAQKEKLIQQYKVEQEEKLKSEASFKPQIFTHPKMR